MVDALSPAVSALAEAAAAGLEATKSMEARVGRARYQGARAVGHPDAGAASILLIFETLASAAKG
jgi:dihydroxyacetone kinase